MGNPTKPDPYKKKKKKKIEPIIQAHMSLNKSKEGEKSI